MQWMNDWVHDSCLQQNKSFNNCSVSSPCNFFNQKTILSLKIFYTITFCSTFSQSDSRCGFLDLNTLSRKSCLAIHRTELWDFPVQFQFNLSWTFARLTVAFLTFISAQIHARYAVCSDSLRLFTTDLPFIKFVLPLLHRISLTELTVWKSLQISFAPFWRSNLIEQFSSYLTGTFDVYQEILLRHDNVVFPVELGCLHLSATICTSSK